MAFATATALIVVALAEGVSFVGLFAAKRVLADPPVRVRSILEDQTARVRRFLADTQHIEEIDSVLGWHYRTSAQAGAGLVNSQGLRGPRQYDELPADSVIRVAAFGDSFVFASEVQASDSWPARLEAEFPGFEVLNYGVPGYGVDQALLRFRLEGSRFKPKYVVMGFATDDLRRLVNVYRRFISPKERPLAKPRFVQSGDSLVVLPPPLRGRADYVRLLHDPASIIKFGPYDQWYKPEVYENPLYDWSASVRLAVTVWRQLWERYFDEDRLFDGKLFNPSSSAFALQVALFEQFDQEARAAGARPLVLFFPDQGSLSEVARQQPPVYQPLIEQVRRRGIDVVDLATAFPARFDDPALASWFAPRGHYSPAGNRLIARAVAAEIQKRENSSSTQIHSLSYR